MNSRPNDINKYKNLTGYNDIETYSSQTIKEWNDELAKIPSLVEKLEKIIAPRLSIIERLNLQLIPVQSHLQSLESQLSIAKTQYAAQQMHQVNDAFSSYSHYDRHGHYYYHGPGLLHTAVDIGLSATLSSQISRLESEINNYRAQFVTPILQELAEHNAIVDRANTEIDWLKARRKLIIEDHLPNAKSFLKKLQNEPEGLFREFLETTRKKLQEYDDNHYNQKSVVLRLCLFDFNERLDKILEDTNEVPIQTTLLYQDFSAPLGNETPKKEWQLKYLQLCGLLWSMRLEVDKPYEDEFFNLKLFNFIGSLLKRSGIPFNGDLPDQMATNLGCIDQFEVIKNKYPNLFNISVLQLDDLEAKRYDSALRTLKDYAKTGHGDKEKLAAGLAYEVEKLIDQQKKDHAKPQYKLYTRVLRQGHTVLICDANDPMKWKIERDFAKLTDHVSGIPSSKKIWGVMAGVTGLILLGVGIALAIPTCGGSIGIGVGLGFLAFLSASSMGGGISLMGLGIGLFANGICRSVSKKISQINAEVEKSHSTQNDFASVRYKLA